MAEPCELVRASAVKPFYVVRHRVLNSPRPRFAKDYEFVQGVSGINRPLVAVFEGDFHAAPWSNPERPDVVLVHAMRCPKKTKFDRLRAEGKAAYLDEVLDAYKRFEAPNTVLCLEAKADVDEASTDTLVESLKSRSIDAYVDSFFGTALDYVANANLDHGTDYKRSLHLIAKLGSLDLAASHPNTPPDIISVPYPCAFRAKTDTPIIYGAVGSQEHAATLATDSNVLGVYLRDKEKHWLRMFKNSFGASTPLVLGAAISIAAGRPSEHVPLKDYRGLHESVHAGIP
ncbi:hypothetical protein HY642_02765 [Candidatus Woesearchaeota archaeon]|nr:hypothetical protein [Candidatus Woesearchaeota archaeon]